jgi:hypothetical protein
MMDLFPLFLTTCIFPRISFFLTSCLAWACPRHTQPTQGPCFPLQVLAPRAGHRSSGLSTAITHANATSLANSFFINANY